MSNPAKGDPRDPRFRPYRMAAYGLYLFVVIGFCLTMLFSIWRSVRSMAPARLPPSATALTVPECLDRAQILFDELEGQRAAFLSKPARQADEEWAIFRSDWQGRFRQAEANCALESRDRKELRALYRQLDRVQDLYTTHAVQFAGEMGGAVDGLKEQMSLARRQASGGSGAQ